MIAQWVILLHELATGAPGSATGQYVVEYHPKHGGGRGYLKSSPAVAEARKFLSVKDAVTYARRSAGRRLDGFPNRPLTAYTLEVMPLARALAREASPL